MIDNYRIEDGFLILPKKGLTKIIPVKNIKELGIMTDVGNNKFIVLYFSDKPIQLAEFDAIEEAEQWVKRFLK